jgi:hypothetical protein
VISTVSCLNQFNCVRTNREGRLMAPTEVLNMVCSFDKSMRFQRNLFDVVDDIHCRLAIEARRSTKVSCTT